jgi:hypothetical protein
MPESKRDTNLQKGARVINAAIAELELPDEVKVSAQQVVTMFATDLLPGLWIRGAAPPTPPAPKPDPAAATPADEADLLASLRREIATLTDTDDEDEIRVSSASTPRADRRPRGRAAAKSPRAAATPREPAPRPPWDESETKIVEAALVTLRYAYLSQISRFEAAVLSAMNRGADSMDVLDLLLGAQEYHRADPALRALQALSPLAAKSDRH